MNVIDLKDMYVLGDKTGSHTDGIADLLRKGNVQGFFQVTVMLEANGKVHIYSQCCDFPKEIARAALEMAFQSAYPTEN